MRTVFSRKQALTRSRMLFALTAALGFSTSGRLSAQTAHPLGVNATQYKIAVVDISAIFKRHARFKATMDTMKKEMEAIENELKTDRDKITQAEQNRNRFNAGTAEYKQADEEVARMMAEFNLKMGRLRKDFLEREAKVYYQTYLEVADAVKYYAKRQNIGLVLRFNGESVDPNQREAVLREINKPVVFQDEIDITMDVLALLNRDQAGANQTGVQPGGQPGIGQGVPGGVPRTANPGSQLPPR